MTATVLVVDDEPDLEVLVLRRFRRQIRDEHISFVFARDGVEALQSIELHPQVDLVVMDINMPRMDGLSLLAKLQEREDKKSAIIVSAYGDMSNIRTAMNRGAFDFLTKPIDFADLEATILKTLRHIEVLREARDRQAEAERAHASLSRYFSPELAKRLAADSDDDDMQVRWRDIAVIFTDITGFTSLVETAALLKGSGLTLTTARVVAFAPWLSSAPPPPSRKAITCHAGSEESTSASASRAPPSGRMKLWTASHAESTQAILSARKSAAVPIAATPRTQGLASICNACNCSGSGSQPKCIAMPVANIVR